jgi:ABC-type Zn2+ transport system, periplasmic component/surface adhesin
VLDVSRQQIGVWLLAWLMPISSWAVPDVVVSIKPVHSLVSMIMRDLCEPHLFDLNVLHRHINMRCVPPEAAQLAGCLFIVWGRTDT